MDHAERVVRAELAGLPRGRWRFEDALDDDGLDSGPVRIAVTLALGGGKVRLDFTGSSPQVPGPVNAVEPVTRAACAYALRCVLGGDWPVNAGAFRPLEIVAPAGTVVNARPPAAVSAGNVETSQRIVDVLLGALAKAVPERIPAASQGTMNNIAFGGYDPGRKRHFAYYETIGGGMGAGATGPGLSGVHTHMTNSLNTPIEALENYLPLKIRSYALRKGSGGRGSNSGGEGIVREYEFSVPVDLTVISERRRFAPYGAGGGGEAATGRNAVESRGRSRPLGGKGNVKLARGDILRIETPGGGGYGRP
jgi:N-methylhydantoinase B/oxoprolinase/acetone carboxylase alpha subunit